jgi:hypothetical protein
MTTNSTSYSSLDVLVDLYRGLGRPKIVDPNYLKYSTKDCKKEAVEKITIAFKRSKELFDKIVINDIDLNGNDKLPQLSNQNSVNILLKIPSDKFYLNLNDFITKASNLSKGKYRRDFYLVDEDYFGSEEIRPSELLQLEKLTKWISFLESVLPHTEKGTKFLKFVLLSDRISSKSQTRTFDSQITISDLDSELTRLSELLGISDTNDTHSHERKSVVRHVIQELLDERHDSNSGISDFSYLLINFDRLCQNYHDNYQIYISGYSFEKIKKEINDNYDDFLKNINSSINETVAKAFAIPASYVAAALLIRFDSSKAFIIVSMAILVTCLITHLMLCWQYKNLTNVKYRIVKAFDYYANSGPSGQELANQTGIELISKTAKAQSIIKLFYIINIVTPLLLLIFLYSKYPNIFDVITAFLNYSPVSE